MLELPSGQKLLLLRNPWARETYNGRWSDNDPLWSLEDMIYREIPQRNDGLFYIGLEQYLDVMDFTYVNYDTSFWHHSYFMLWDDEAIQNGETMECGDRCSRHTLSIESDVAQRVWIGAHTYRFYTYPDALG